MTFISGLTELDMILLTFNPLFGGLGACIGSIIITSDLNNLQSEKNNWRASWTLECFNWLFSRALIGFILGAVIACFATGELTANSYSLLKVIGFTLLASSIAPRVWVAQENSLLQCIDNKIDHAIKTNK